jgi:pyridoxine 5-phosphate synthase
MTRLNVNIDHIATLRQARRSHEPNLVWAATLAQIAGADGITVHLRSDRRHIQDKDVQILRMVIDTHLNLEMATTEEMVRIASEIKPTTATLVPERPDEITTEGGLDVIGHEAEIRVVIEHLRSAGVMVSIFLDPVLDQIEAACRVGAGQIEICTARYAELTNPTRHVEPAAREQEVAQEVHRVAECAGLAGRSGLQVAAGHGLSYRNVRRIAEIDPMEELNIGHSIVSRAALLGMERSVADMIEAMGRQ